MAETEEEKVSTGGLDPDKDDEVMWKKIDTIQLNKVGSNKIEPVLVKLMIEDELLTFEVDTGSDCTVIPFDSFMKLFPNIPVKPDNVKVSTLFILIDKPVFTAIVNVKYEKSVQKLEVRLIDFQSKICLLDKSWLNLLLPEWQKQFNSMSKEVGVNLNRLECTKDELARLKKKYTGVFNKNDCIKYFTVNIKIRGNAVPKFCKPYRIPFAVKDKVKKEITKLVEQGILKPVETTDWASKWWS